MQNSSLSLIHSYSSFSSSLLFTIYSSLSKYWVSALTNKIFALSRLITQLSVTSICRMFQNESLFVMTHYFQSLIVIVPSHVYISTGAIHFANLPLDREYC